MTSPNRRWLGRLLLAVSFLKSSPLYAQAMEVGGSVGLARVEAVERKLSVSGGMFASAGVEFSAHDRSDRYAFFADYSHWARLLPSRSPTITGVDFACLGGRIHGPNLPGGVRGFVDLAWGVGQYRSRQPTGKETIFGYMYGGGVIVPIGDRWYVRPQFRGYFVAIPEPSGGDYSALGAWSLRVGVGIRL